MPMNTLFPVFLKIENLNTLIVGGGNVGLEKLEAVLRNAPKSNITLIAPEIREEIRQYAKKHSITLIQSEYHANHLKGIDLVIAGTNRKEINKKVRDDCKEAGILINVADTPELCDFYLSSVVQKGDLKIAISTNGKSPTFAKRFREILEAILPESLQETLDNLQAIRNKLKGDFEYKVDKLNEITKIMREKDQD